jgi:hypothetical protein
MVCRKTVVLKTVILPATTRDIGELLSAAHALNPSQYFLKLLSNVRFLAGADPGFEEGGSTLIGRRKACAKFWATPPIRRDRLRLDWFHAAKGSVSTKF